MKTIKNTLKVIAVMLGMMTITCLMLSCEPETITNTVTVEVEGEQLALDPNLIGKWRSHQATEGKRDIFVFTYEARYSQVTIDAEGYTYTNRYGKWFINGDGLLVLENDISNYGDGASTSNTYDVTNNGKRFYLNGKRYNIRLVDGW